MSMELPFSVYEFVRSVSRGNGESHKVTWPYRCNMCHRSLSMPELIRATIRRMSDGRVMAEGIIFRRFVPVENITMLLG